MEVYELAKTLEKELTVAKAEVEKYKLAYDAVADFVRAYQMAKDIDINWNKFPEQQTSIIYKSRDAWKKMAGDLVSAIKEVEGYNAYGSECVREVYEIIQVRAAYEKLLKEDRA